MEKTTYEIEAEVEETHWWFVGRRCLLSDIINKLSLNEDIPILDIGSSTGTNLRLLKYLGFKNYEGIDISEEAIKYCTMKNLGKVKKGNICNLKSKDNSYKLILATDIIEHINDDLAGMMEMKRVIAPDGSILVSVPAFQFLWGIQDEVSHHKKRYTKNQLEKLINSSGLICQEIFYFNYILFFPILFIRIGLKLFKIKIKSENQINTKIINFILKLIFLLDIKTARYLKLPFGVSLLAIIKKGS